MASIVFRHLGFTTSIAAGDTHHWWWNNAPSEQVWSISADAVLTPKAILLGGATTAQIEITKVEYRHNYDGKTFEREIHFWIRNNGKGEADFNIHMVQIGE
jgi:hypothetical protein